MTLLNLNQLVKGLVSKFIGSRTSTYELWGNNSVCNIWENMFPRIVLVDLRKNPLPQIYTRGSRFPSVPRHQCRSSDTLWIQVFHRHACPGRHTCHPLFCGHQGLLYLLLHHLSAWPHLSCVITVDYIASSLCLGKTAAERTQLKGSGLVVKVSVPEFICSLTEMEMERGCLFFGSYCTAPACLYLEAPLGLSAVS